MKPDEIATVEEGLRRLGKVKHFIVETNKDAIVVFLPHQDPDSLVEGLRPLLGGGRNFPAAFNVERHLHYTPMMRFVLRDKKRRLFSVERWCFLGSIDNWFPLAAADELSTQVQRYAPHLGQESFFELM